MQFKPSFTTQPSTQVQSNRWSFFFSWQEVFSYTRRIQDIQGLNTSTTLQTCVVSEHLNSLTLFANSIWLRVSQGDATASRDSLRTTVAQELEHSDFIR